MGECLTQGNDRERKQRMEQALKNTNLGKRKNRKKLKTRQI